MSGNKDLIQRNLIDHSQLFFAERCAGGCFYIVQDLLGLGSTDEDAGHFLVVEKPAKSHVGKLLPALCSKVVQLADLIQAVFIQSALFEESSICADTAVFRDSVKITVRELALGKRAEGDQALVQPACCFFQAIFSTVLSKME